MWLSPDWLRRAPVHVDNWGGGSGNVNATLTIPPSWDLFWTTVLSTGFDLRFCRADGLTALAYKRDTWNHTARSGVLKPSTIPVVAGGAAIWMYWGNAAATDGGTTPDIATPKVGSLFLGTPSPRTRILVEDPPLVGSPKTRIRKGASEQLQLAWDFRPQLVQSRAPISGKRIYEEIQTVTSISVINAAEEAQAGMIDTASTRLLDGGVITWLQAGTSGTSYICICQVQTTLSRVLEGRCRLDVRDVEL